MKIFYTFMASLLALGQLLGQTIAEKKAGIGSTTGDGLSPEMKTFLMQVNNEVIELQQELDNLYLKIEELYYQNAPMEDFEFLLGRINGTKERIHTLQETWHQVAVNSSREAGYALWNQPETTIGQLVNDFGSYNYLYMASPEISTMKISLDSNLPIPRGSWDEVLAFVLNQSGIGIRQLNPYVRELYLYRSDLSGPKIMTANREDLLLFPDEERVVFVLSPDAAEARRVWYFLDKFANSNTTTLQMIGRDILIVGRIAAIQDLLRIYDFVSTHRGDKEYKAIRVHKVDVEEMAKILTALFESITEEPREIQQSVPRPGQFPGGPGRGPDSMPPGRRPPESPPSDYRQGSKGAQQVYGSSSLKVIALKDVAQALFLVGTKEEIEKAEEIIRQVEDQVGDTRRKEIVWYQIRHSDPEELAQILVRIYDLMVATGTGSIEDDEGLPPDERAFRNFQRREAVQSEVVEAVAELPRIPIGVINDTGFLSTANYLHNPEDRRKPRMPPNQGRDNFLVDPKTGSLIMVIEEDLIPQIKNLIKKLDVPKRMVQIEVMLVEQVINNENDIGLNFLKIGSLASQCDSTNLIYNGILGGILPDSVRNVARLVPGITDFIVTRAPHGGIPAYDLAYHFLISRDDVRISASPSLLTENETEASIEFEQEISVSVGTFVIPNAGTATLQETFARATYGIRIDVIPTIHMHDPDSPCDDGIDYITLDSDVKFETFTSDVNNRPNVLRRRLQNQARIADGQTVIIGGFRRKDAQDTTTSIPFLGEIPGFGKLFSNTQMSDTAVETFLFLTAKIASEPSEDLEAIKMEEMARRPGDLPYFMQALRDARETEQNRFLAQTMQLLFGREPERYIDKEACPYDGR